MPLADRTEYGKEDHVFAMALKKVVTLQRACTPELWHLYHSKAGWGISVNGMATSKQQRAAAAAAAGSSSSTAANSPNNSSTAGGPQWRLELPKPDGPQVIQDRLGAKLDGYRCTRLLTHSYV